MSSLGVPGGVAARWGLATAGEGGGLGAVGGTPVNPLANPKGVKHACELCGQTATLQCSGCRVAYYCCAEHQELDWSSIHSRICSHLASLRNQPAVLGSEEERARKRRATREAQLTLIDLTRQAALKFLNRGEYQPSIPAALQTLKLSIDVYGPTALELVTAYLLLGEFSIGLGKHAQAETYLSSAKWAVLKNPSCPSHIRAALSRNFGKLYAAMGNQDVALQYFAHDVYYSSLDAGPLSFAACGGYFHLGCAFQAKGSNDQALAMYAVSVGICIDALRNAVDKSEEYERSLDLAMRQAAAATGGGADGGIGGVPALSKEDEERIVFLVMNEAQQAECFHMLSVIASAREQLVGALSAESAEAQFGLGLCHMLTREFHRAESCLSRAYDVLSDASGPSSELTQSAQSYLERASHRTMILRTANKLNSLRL